MSNISDIIYSLVYTIAGVFFMFLVYGPLPKNQRKRVDKEIWRRKYGKLFKIISPILIAGGILLLIWALIDTFTRGQN